GQIFVEAHPDVYRRIPDYYAFAMEKLKQYPLSQRVDQRRFWVAITLKSGVPINVSMPPKYDFGQMMIDTTQN
ncbi:MAG: hypothetical protein WCA08_24505, partial [Desulfoferrobacter sp.]